MTEAYSESPSAPIRIRTYDLPIRSSDALPLSFSRLAGAKTIKQGHETNILHTARIGMSMCGICAMERNVMVYVKPGE